MPSAQSQPTLLQAEPVLVVSDITATVNYWHEVLGFPNKWTWGEPPNHGGVTWHSVFIQFTLNPELAAVSKGYCVWIRVRNLQELYKFHQDSGAEIIRPIENKPWGLAEYIVKEINSHYIIFSGAMQSEKQQSSTLPETVKITSRKPTAEEYVTLVNAVGWKTYSNAELLEKILSAPVFAVVAQDEQTNKTIGCALLLSDGATFYYVKDVMVHPEWQRKGVGSAMMKALADWLDENAGEHAYTALITGENLKSFYQQFDFVPVFGMHRPLRKKNK